MDRFFYPTLSGGTTVTLLDDEFHHLVHVLRGKVGQHVELFDGQGASAEAVIEKLSKRDAQLSLVSEIRRDPPPETTLVLGVAAPKGDRLKWLVEKGVELGVDEFIPLVCERSVVEPREAKLAKLEQTVIAACKQSRRNTLMKIREPLALAEFVGLAPDPVWIAHPGGEPLATLLAERRRQPLDPPLPIWGAVGPEGGFSDAELEQLVAAGARLVSLGRNVLRVETAALAFAAIALAGANSGEIATL
jgi:16S rRNA (uracil1498-N3)-methyltransferase